MLSADPAFELEIAATGMHLAPEFGLTVQDIEKAGFTVHHRVESLLSSDTPEGVGKSVGISTMGFAQLFARWRPDILVVHGDRFDMFPAVVAALPYRIPVAHISGGDVTEGVIDDAIRHAMTKLSHLHFVETDDNGQRVLQMGEEPWRVTVCGSLAIDTIRQTELMNAQELEQAFGIRSEERYLLATFHPATLEPERTAQHISEVLAAIQQAGLPCVFTYPNADTASREIIAAINAHCANSDKYRVIVNAGQRGYLSLMAHAAAMVGNSSSGIVEAASFRLPVVNVGDRQRGRIRPLNVTDCLAERGAIFAAIQKAISVGFRNGLHGLQNPYGDGHAAERIVRRLAEIEISNRLIVKRFYEAEKKHAETA